MEDKLSLGQQHTLSAKKANNILGCVMTSVVSLNQQVRVIIPLQFGTSENVLGWLCPGTQIQLYTICCNGMCFEQEVGLDNPQQSLPAYVNL